MGNMIEYYGVISYTLTNCNCLKWDKNIMFVKRTDARRLAVNLQVKMFETPYPTTNYSIATPKRGGWC